MKVTIEEHSGYCFGVEYAIQLAEQYLNENKELYCLGDIVHNDVEVERLKKLGLKIIDHNVLSVLKDKTVLIRAHGEPPKTYKIALENNLCLIDASCPVVLKLQNRITNSFDVMTSNNGQTVILGKHGHAEVEGLLGQTEGKAIVIQGEDEIDKIDFSKPINLFSQTTKSKHTFQKMKSIIEQKIKDNLKDEVLEESTGILKSTFKANDSICRQVSNREPILQEFSRQKDLIIFVGGKKSSNGASLFQTCKEQNSRAYFIETTNDLSLDWFSPNDDVGICGATSTPRWLMEEVQVYLEGQFNN